MAGIPLTLIDDPASVGRRLQDARKAAGLSLRRLAFPGCTAAYISTIERGRRVASPELLAALAGRLNVSASYLAHGMVEADLEALLVEGELALRLEQLEHAEHAFARAAELASSDRQLGCALAGLAELLLHRAETAAGIELLERVRGLLGPAIEDHLGVLESLGRAYAMQSEYDLALEAFESGRRLAQTRRDRPGQLRFALLLTNASIDLGDIGSAAEALALATLHADALGDPLLSARVHWSQSRLHAVEGHYALAAQLAHQALRALEQSDDDYQVARAHHLIAYVELERGRPDAGLEWLERALPIIVARGDAFELALFQLEHARCLAALGDLDRARHLALEAAPALERTAKGDAARCLTVLAEVFTATGDDDEAGALLDLAIDKLADHRSPHLIRALRARAALLERAGKPEAALELLERAIDLEAPPSTRRQRA
jgi:tetratricopeptide (TPR) repeat protein